MSMITLLVVAVAATVLLAAGVRAIMTHVLEHDRSFRTDLDASIFEASIEDLAPGARETA